jgi:hypothetical protein
MAKSTMLPPPPLAPKPTPTQKSNHMTSTWFLLHSTAATGYWVVRPVWAMCMSRPCWGQIAHCLPPRCMQYPGVCLASASPNLLQTCPQAHDCAHSTSQTQVLTRLHHLAYGASQPATTNVFKLFNVQNVGSTKETSSHHEQDPEQTTHAACLTTSCSRSGPSADSRCRINQPDQ